MPDTNIKTVTAYRQMSDPFLAIDEARAMLPEHLRDSYWEPCLSIFLAVPRLREYIDDYFNFERQEICADRFNREVKPYLSSSEQFMVSLAFHLFNHSQNPLPDDGLLGLRQINADWYWFAINAIHRASGRGAHWLQPKRTDQ